MFFEDITSSEAIILNVHLSASFPPKTPKKLAVSPFNWNNISFIDPPSNSTISPKKFIPSMVFIFCFKSALTNKDFSF